MTPTPLIGLTGAAGSGKTTAANWFLVNHTNLIKLSFARPLKRMLYELLREVIPKAWPHTAAEYTDNPQLKNAPMPFLAGQSPRFLMQTLGTEWGRNAVHENFWVDIAAAKVERLLADPRHKSASYTLRAIFDDTRFPNEAEMIRRFGGIIVRIERPDNPNTIGQEHASEARQSLVTPDVTVLNDGTADDLRAKLAALWPPTVKPKA
jgi:hypothetical protein